MNLDIKNKLTVAVVILLTSLLTGCGGDDPSATEGLRKNLTNGIWNISKVTVDGVDKTEEFEGMTLQFASNTFTSTNGAPVWPGSGVWIFNDASGRNLLRDDGVVVTVVSVTANHLVMDLNWDKATLGSGRVSSISGDYIFEFTR